MIEDLALNPLALAGILTAGIAVAVIGLGVVLGFVNLLISRQVTAVVDSDDYQKKVNKLEQKQKEQLTAMRDGRTTAAAGDHHRPGWVTATTFLTILMFVTFIGYIVNSTVFPNGELTTAGGEAISTTPYVLISMLLITLVVLIAVTRTRPEWIFADGGDKTGIPWDTIAVLISALAVVGLGMGAMVLLLGNG